jgi:hypothetical protein
VNVLDGRLSAPPLGHKRDAQSVTKASFMIARKRTFVQAGCFGRNWPSVACTLPNGGRMKRRGLVLEALRDGLCPFRVEPSDGRLHCRIRIMREDVPTFAGLLRRQVMNAVTPPSPLLSCPA